jgi:hypothetical protein
MTLKEYLEDYASTDAKAKREYKKTGMRANPIFILTDLTQF